MIILATLKSKVKGISISGNMSQETNREQIHRSILCGSVANVHLKKFDGVQYNALRVCIGALWSSLVLALLIEAPEPPLRSRRRNLDFQQITALTFFYSNTRINNQIFQGFTDH